MAITITNRQELIEALSVLGVQVSAEQGVFDGLFAGGSGGAVTASDITDATVVGRNVLKAADAASARTAIGAVALGTTSSTAKAGNYTPTSAEVSNALKTKAAIAALTKVAAESAFDQATAIALANESKLAINAIIDALKA